MTYLDLKHNHLVNLPSGIGNLKEITYLSLNNNELISLPENIGNLIKLPALDLSFNQLSSLPDSFGNLQSLLTLDLYYNLLKNLPKNFGNLQNLSSLNLSINKLSILPDSFVHLYNLTNLNLSINQMESIPENIGNLKNLQYLNLEKNSINELPISIGNLINLTSLGISDNHLTFIPSTIENLLNLQTINAAKNKLTELPKSINNLTNLQKIYLSENELEEFPYYISDLPNLQEIDLSSNRIKSITDRIENFKSLFTLNLSNNSFYVISKKIEKLVNLQNLFLSNCLLKNDTIPSELFNLNSLRHLSLDSNQISSIPEDINKLTNLVHLSLANNFIESNINKSLCNLTNLHSLNLSGNNGGSYSTKGPMKGDIPLEFSKLKNLIFLNLSNTKLYTSSPTLEKFIIERTINWNNNIPDKPVRPELTIAYITTSSDNLGYSLNSTIPILIVMTQPVTLKNGELVMTFETGITEHQVSIQAFASSYTAIGIYKVHEDDFSEDLNIKSITLTNGATLKDVDGNDVDLSLIDEINLASMKNVYVDGTIPTINISYPTVQDDCFEQLHKINGTAGDCSGDFSVTLEIIGGNENWDDTKSFYIPVKGQATPLTTTWEFEPPQYIWKYNSSHTVRLSIKDFVGNTNEIIKNVTYGKRESTISCNFSENSIIIGESIQITGNITPTEGVIDAGISIELIPPSGYPIYRSTRANINGYFDYKLKCSDIRKSGEWEVKTSWEGNGCLEKAQSEVTMLSVVKATSRLILDTISQAIKLDTEAIISGKFIPQFECDNLKDTPISIQLQNDDSLKIVSIKTSDTGNFVISSSDPEFQGLDTIGEWRVQGIFTENESFERSFDILKIQVVETAGYAVIIQGKIESGEGLRSNNKTANFVYKQLKEQRGLLDEDIIYFNYDSDQEGVDYKTSKIRIKKAITEDVRDKMNEKPANLYIIMLDHGTKETFYIDPEVINSSEFAEWLSMLEENLNAQAKNQETVVILGFCFSGSFIDDLSGYKRVIITSAGPNEFSYKGPLDNDMIREGEYFVSEFFKSIYTGQSIKDAFSEAVNRTEVFTAKESGSVNAPPYFDSSSQHPLLDDNGDGKGSNDIILNKKDGQLAKDIFIGVSPSTHNDPGDVYIEEVVGTIFLKENETTTDELWAIPNDINRLLTLWIEIKHLANNYIPLTAVSGQINMNLERIVYDPEIYEKKDRKYQYQWKNIGEQFKESGTYQVFYFAKDVYTKNVSPIVETRVYKNKYENKPPDSFALISPLYGIEITSYGVVASCAYAPTPECYTIMTWEYVEDPDDDLLSYTIFIKKGNDDFENQDNLIKAEELTNNFWPIHLPDDWDGATVYWKVQAIDKYGAIRDSNIYSFVINNTYNPVIGTISGYVFDSESQMPIENAKVTVDNSLLFTNNHGVYREGFTLGANYKLIVKKEGYYSETRYPVLIPSEENFFLIQKKDYIVDDIDINGSIDIYDIIFALKVLAGIEVDNIKNDHIVSLKDILFIMNKYIK